MSQNIPSEPRATRKDYVIVLTAQVVSLIFSPFYLPVMAFVPLLAFSYLNMLPIATKLVLLAMVYVFTILIPRFAIYLYRKFNGWTRHQLGKREQRFVPYLLSIASYAALLYTMNAIHMPRFSQSIIVGALAIQLVCGLLNSRLKISTHAAASGGVVGALMGFSIIIPFDPTAWLCLTILLCGMVCTARLILRQHTLGEVGLGAAVGFACGLASVVAF